MRATIGFTLLELLVVIAIAAVVAGITLPASRTMVEQNHVMTCSANLQRLGVALKAYYLDYEGVPPVLIPETALPPSPGSSDPYDEMLNPATVPEGYPVSPQAPPELNPLMVLYRGGYLRDRRTLHCPLDRLGVNADAGDPAYFQSYTGRQPDTTDPEKLVKIQFQGEDILINRYKYLPCRMWTLPNAPPWTTEPLAYTQRRELANDLRMDSLTTGQGTPQAQTRLVWGTHLDPGAWPNDTTVVTWCGLHADKYEKDGYGVYLVLFWDGSVQLKDRALFELGAAPIDPPAAWEVSPGD